MQQCKKIKVIILVGVNLHTYQFTKAHEEEEDMSRVPM
jgi:hypothetical protein